MDRRKFITAAATLGATTAIASPVALLDSKPQTKRHSLPKIIAVEEHFTLPDISAEVMKYLTKMNGGNPPVSPTQRDLMKIVLPDNAIQELGASRLAFMDKAGVTMQVLSYGAGSPQNIAEVALATELCQQANDQLATIIAQHPDRYSGFALLPMADPQRAAQELTRSVEKLGLKGAMLSGTYNGVFFDEERFRPVFAEAERLSVPIFLHPAIINKQVADYYFNSPQWSAVAGAMFATAGFGWHADAGIALVRFIISGIFDQHPNLQIISGHWGELVPFYLNRLDDQLSKTLQLKLPISEYFKRNIYITSSGFFNNNQLRYCVDEIGADRILYSVDYPFLRDEKARQFLEKAPISSADKRKIAFENAVKLLHISL